MSDTYTHLPADLGATLCAPPMDWRGKPEPVIAGSGQAATCPKCLTHWGEPRGVLLDLARRLTGAIERCEPASALLERVSLLHAAIAGGDAARISAASYEARAFMRSGDFFHYD